MGESTFVLWLKYMTLLLDSISGRIQSYLATSQVCSYERSYFKILLLLFQMCMDICVHARVCVQCPKKPKEGVGSPEIIVTDGCKLPCVSWEPNPILLQ